MPKIAEVVIPIVADVEKLVEGYRKGIEKTKKFQEAVSKIGKRFLTLGTVVSGFGMAAVKTFGNFEQGILEVSTMLDKSDKKYLQAYKKAILDMSAKFGEGTKTITRGLYDILSAGIDASGALKVLEASVKMAKAGLTETGVAADALTTILNSFSLSAERAADVSDLMFKIVKKGKTTMGELAPQIGMVASLAASAGLSMEEMGAALATMTAAGLRTEIAVTALRGIISTFLSPTEEAAKAARELGFELNSTTLQTIGLKGVIDKLTTASQEQVAAVFGNIRALTGMSALLQNSTKYAEDLQDMMNRAGATNEAFAEIAKGVNYQLNQLWQSFKTLIITLGEKLIPTARKLMNTLQRWADGIRNVDEGTIELITRLGVIGAKVALLGGAFLVAIPKIMQFGQAMSALGQLLKAHPILAIASALATIGTVGVSVADALIDRINKTKEAEAKAGKEAEKSLRARYEHAKKLREEKLKELREAKKGSEEEARLRMEYVRLTRVVLNYEKMLREERRQAAEELPALQREAWDEMARDIDAAYAEMEAREREQLEARKDEIRAYEELAQERLRSTLTAMSTLTSAWAANLSNSFFNAMMSIGRGWKKFSKSFSDLGKQMLQSVIRYIAEMGGEWVAQMLVMQIATKGWASVVWLAKQVAALAEIIYKAVRDNPFWAALAAIGIGVAAVKAAFGKIKFFEYGGIMPEPGWALVGEKGPELVRLPAGARVYNTEETERAIGRPVQVNLHIDALDPDSITESQWERIADRLKAFFNFEGAR